MTLSPSLFTSDSARCFFCGTKMQISRGRRFESLLPKQPKKFHFKNVELKPNKKSRVHFGLF